MYWSSCNWNIACDFLQERRIKELEESLTKCKKVQELFKGQTVFIDQTHCLPSIIYDIYVAEVTSILNQILFYYYFPVFSFNLMMWYEFTFSFFSLKIRFIYDAYVWDVLFCTYMNKLSLWKKNMAQVSQQNFSLQNKILYFLILSLKSHIEPKLGHEGRFN